MTRTLDILVLHGIGEMATARKTLVDFVTSFERFAPHHNYLYHDGDSVISSALRRFRFDVVLLDSTFLDARTIQPLEISEGYRRRYDFVRDSDAVKIALPQDEYDTGGVLDDWLADWRVDLVSACGVHQHWDVVFPRTSKVAEIRKGLTGFFDPERAARLRAKYPPLAQRPIDLGYRVNRLPPEFGRFGRAKSELADVFAAALEGGPLRVDISCDRAKMIMGDAWWDFLGSCKFTLGSESGSSIWDPRGEIRRRVGVHRAEHPDATFDEVEAACFPGVDGRYTFRMISPRVFESAAVMASQVLLRGDYLGLIEPWTHYLPVDEDFGNLPEVIESMKDLDAAQRRAEACFETFTHTPRIHYPTYVREIIAYAETRALERALPGRSTAEFHALREAQRRAGWSDRLVRRGISLARRLEPVRRLIPIELQRRILARFGRNIGLKPR